MGFNRSLDMGPDQHIKCLQVRATMQARIHDATMQFKCKRLGCTTTLGTGTPTRAKNNTAVSSRMTSVRQSWLGSCENCDRRDHTG